MRKLVALIMLTLAVATEAQTPIKKPVVDSLQLGSNANDVWSAGTRSYSENAALSSNKTLQLPDTRNYLDGARITYEDSKTTGSFGRLFFPGGSDTLNGQNAAYWVANGYYQPFIGGGANGRSKSSTFQKNGTNWREIGNDQSIYQITKPGDASAKAVIVADNLPTATTLQLKLPGQNATWLVPSASTDPTNTVPTEFDANGNAVYSTINVVPDTTGHAAGETLQVASDGGFGWNPSTTSAAGYQVLDATTNPIVWPIVAGARVQNAIVTLPGSRPIEITGSVSSGYDFNLIVKQPSGGGATITGLPAGSRTGDGGAGVIASPPLTSTGNAVDWVKGSYTGQTGFEWLWGVFQKNLTAATVTACNTLGATGATSGTNSQNQQSTTRRYMATNFIADSTSICKIEANWFSGTGSPNYDLRAYVCPDVVRLTFTGASTTSGSSTVTLNASGIANEEIGQRISGLGIPANTYVKTVDATANTCTLYSTRTGTGGSDVTATSSGTGTVTIYGAAGTPVNASGSDPVNTLSLPTTSGGADTTPAVFTLPTGTVTGLTIGANYFVVIGTSGTLDGTNYASWLYDTNTTTNGFKFTRSTTNGGGTWTGMNPNRKARMKTYH
jgi:hypothetical protein